MRVFITGGTGFVGSHVVDYLLKAGHQPVCLVRKTSDTRHLDQLKVDQVVGSLSDIQALMPTLEQSESVVHVAGVIKAKTPADFFRFNATAAGDLAKAAAEANPKLHRFVHVSSVAAQGPSPGPMPRPRDLKPDPVSDYGRSKLAGEQAVLALQEHIPITIVRPPAVYGPRDRETFKAFQLAKFGLAPVVGGDEARMSLVHAYDVADAIVATLEQDHPSGAIFCVDDGFSYSWREMGELIGRALGRRPVPFKVPGLIYDVAARFSETYGKLANQAVIFNRDKVIEMRQKYWISGHDAIRETLDWQPQWRFEQGAKQTAQWYLQQGWL